MQGKEKNKRCKKELPKDIMGFCVGLVVGSCVLCSEESAEKKLEDTVARQNTFLTAKKKCNQTHVCGLVGRLTHRIARWAGGGIL